MASSFSEDRSTSSLIANVIADLQLLIRDEVRLAKKEISEEIARGKKNLAMNAVAFALMAYGVVLLGISLAYALVEAGLPWWASLGVLALLYGGGGSGMLLYLRKHAVKMHYLPQETVKNIKETLEAVRRNSHGSGSRSNPEEDRNHA